MSYTVEQIQLAMNVLSLGDRANAETQAVANAVVQDFLRPASNIMLVH